MKFRQLGQSSLSVSPLCFGGNVFGWTTDEATSFAVLDAFVEAGMNFIDTADVYSIWVPGHVGGESETLIGKWLQQRGGRDKVIIATKAGAPMGPDKKGLSKKYLRSAIEDSLRRLQTDYVDLYQSHRDDPDTPIEETLEAFGDMIKAGYVRFIGASNFTPERFTESLDTSARLGLPRYESLQPLYNLFDRQDFEQSMQKICVDRHVGVINYYSLASGFLTGKYRSEADTQSAARGATVRKYTNDRGFRILAALDEVADQHHARPGQVALAWLMSRPAIAAPIASATSVQQLAELIGATRLELDQASLDRLNAASA